MESLATSGPNDEEWRPVVGHPGYEVSSLGRVRSWRKRGQGVGLRSEPLMLKLSLSKNGGYPTVRLDRRMCPVHRLVLEAFIGPRSDGYDCCHGDGCRTNNRLDNLRWDTRQANVDDRRVHQGIYQSKRRRMTESMAAEIVIRAKSGETFTDLGREFGFSDTYVRKVASGKAWGDAAKA